MDSGPFSSNFQPHLTILISKRMLFSVVTVMAHVQDGLSHIVWGEMVALCLFKWHWMWIASLIFLTGTGVTISISTELRSGITKLLGSK